MRLYIVRHAIAVPRGTPGIRDDDRDLTPDGIRRMRHVAEGLRRLGYMPDLLLSSPLVRAARTAEILLAAFGKGIKMEIIASLAPSGSRREFYREMSRYSKLPSLMIVGHQPCLGEIAGEIVWGSPECFVDLKKGGACAIDVERAGVAPRGSLVSLLPPSIVRKIVD